MEVLPPQPQVHNTSPDHLYATGRLAGAPNRWRRAPTKARSARVEKISTGEYPRRHARRNVAASASPVTTKFGHPFSAHWPDQVRSHALEKGRRYGIGHWYPSGPRAPTMSPSRWRWNVRRDRSAAIHRREASSHTP